MTEHTPSPVDRLAGRIARVSETARTQPYGLVMAQILADSLISADLTRRNYWRPEQDPQPGPEITTVYDGKVKYHREHNRWHVDEVHPDTGQQVWGDYSWADIPAPLLVDTTPPHEGGQWQLNKPLGGIPVSDWRATEPDEVEALLANAVAAVKARRAAGAVATKWTAPSGLPIFLIWFNEDGTIELKTGTDSEDQPGQ